MIRSVVPAWWPSLLRIGVIVLGAAGAPSCRQNLVRPETDGLATGPSAADAAIPAAGAATLRLDAPVACPAGAGCVVRNFVDHDPGPDARDFHCGRLAYDGHRGTDIRVPDGAAMAQGVPVLAAAAGVVLRVRDGVADVSTRVTGRSAVRDHEAGNSVIIDHGDGWQTQYGHLRRGSVRVRPGQRVDPGAVLGVMGLSGGTEFTHVHFEVRRDDVPIDPYTGSPIGTTCGAGGAPLWTPAALTTLACRETALFDAGFAVGQPDAWLARAGEYATAAPARDSPAVVFWVDVIGARDGDRQTFRVVGPGDEILAERTDAVAESGVQWFAFLGRKRPTDGWRPGTYRGSWTLRRETDGELRTILEVRRAIALR